MLKQAKPFIAVGLVVIAALVAALMNDNAATPTQSAVGDGRVMESLSPVAYQTQFADTEKPHLLIDVRTPEEFASGHIAGAVNIPLDVIGNRLSEIPTDQPVVVYCRSGNRSAQAARILGQAGYSPLYDLGGVIAWTGQGYPLQ